MINDMNVCQYDTLDIDADIRKHDGTVYTLAEGDKLWLTIKKSFESEALINIKTDTKYFEIDEIELSPGDYLLEMGIIYADERSETLVQSKLFVADRLRGEDE